MGARGARDGVLGLLVAELSQRVRVGPAAEDNGLGADVEALARHAIENTDAGRTPVLFYEASHLAVVCDRCAALRRRQSNSNIRARVVVHGLVEDLRCERRSIDAVNGRTPHRTVAKSNPLSCNWGNRRCAALGPTTNDGGHVKEDSES